MVVVLQGQPLYHALPRHVICFRKHKRVGQGAQGVHSGPCRFQCNCRVGVVGPLVPSSGNARGTGERIRVALLPPCSVGGAQA